MTFIHLKSIQLYLIIIAAGFACLSKATAQSISAGSATGTISACVGSASASPNIQQFTVSGSSLTGNIIATAPTGFEVSLSATGGYNNSVIIPQTGGTVAGTVVYVGSAASAPTGTISGNVVLSSTGATAQNVAVTGTINALPTVNAVPNQAVANGAATTAINFTGTANTFTWVNNTPGIGLAASGSGNIPSFTAVNTGSSPVSATITAMPLNADLAYITNGGSNTVSVVNVITNQVIASIPVGQNPYSVAIKPDNSLVYVGNMGDGSISVINPSTNSVINTISTGSPGGLALAISPNGTRLYAVNNSADIVSVINTTTDMVIATIPTGGGALGPTGVTVSLDGSLLYVDNGYGISVISTTTSTIVSNIPIGTFGGGLSISPDGRRLYLADYTANTVSVIDIATNTVTSTINVGSTPSCIAVSPDGNFLYVSNQGSNTVSVINTNTNLVTTTIPVGEKPAGVAVTPNGDQVFVANIGSGTVSVINTTTNSVQATVIVGLNPTSITDSFISNTASCAGAPVTFTIAVNASPPGITASSATGAISACAGTASASPYIKQFTASGSDLTGNITAAAPAGFEVSLSAGSGYGNSVTLPQTGGTVAGTAVYVRSAASVSTGNISGNVVLSSPNAASQNVAVTATVYALPTVNTVPNQTVATGTATTAINFAGTANTFTWVNNTPGIGLAASGTGNIASFTAVNTGSSPVSATITATPQSYPPLAYIPNGDGGIAIINTLTHAVLSTMPFNGIAFGLAASPNGGLLYCANSGQNAVSVINTTTDMVITAIPVGTGPSGLALTPDGNRVYVANNSSNSVSVINTSTNAVVATIPVAAAPVGITVSMNGDYVYVANSASNTIAVISTAANAVVSSISLPANSYPYYMALSPVASDVLYVTNSGANTVSAINTTTNTITATIPVGTHPQGITVSADGSRLYVTNNGSANLSVINTATNTVVATIGVGSGPSGVAITPDGSQVYVINNNSNTVSIIGTASDAVNTTITVNGSPYATGNFIVPGGGCTGAPITFAFNINPASAIGTTGGPSALHTIYGTPSASTSFNVTGTNLNANVLITPPAGFEVSTDNVNFTGTVEIADGTGTINSTPVYIRLAAITPVGTYKGNIVLSSSGAANVNVAMPASTVTPAALTIKALDQSKAYGTPNPLFTFDITGFVNDESSANLTTQPTLSTTAVTNSPVGTYPITINGAADPNYTITFVNATLTVIPAALTITVVNQTKVYGAPMPTLTLSYTGFANGDTEASLTTKPTVTTAATASSPVGQYVMDVGGASDPNYSINYFQGTLTIIPASLTITANDQTKAFGAPNPVLTVSYSGFVNGDTEASLTPQPSVTTTATVLSPAGTYPITASGAADNNYTITYVTGTLTVTAQPPNIAGAGNLSPLNTVYGTPSTATIFTISGTGMTAGILVTPPAGFQVSANDANYSATVTVGGAGDITATTVYIRLAATTPVGDYSGNIVLSSSGAASFDLAMPSSTVSPASLTITANDKSKIYDTPNPALTVSYSGFVNNDGPGQLTTQPVVTTDALTTSPVGEYPITVSGAASPNYTITYVAGILTINPVPPHIVIPNTFTPNGDGINDTWNVKYLDLYPGCYVQIFTRYGQKVFSSTGYGTPWDGTYGGTTVTTGTYYYIIDLKNGSSPFSGWVAVIR